ncbi:IclR family transcriptional regulator [Microbacterium invictum]|uniref:IclR family transcriptional regulator n=1 Tax=Microbacterium invictum TaxID=515415 RepID=A0ABZ0VFZ2_9MICO|nr:IclR family transcriptional regulator [Microbacterium invictum]WQB70702.1 IclR family transcriptional regulator [Microbacterium invictum]
MSVLFRPVRPGDAAGVSFADSGDVVMPVLPLDGILISDLSHAWLGALSKGGVLSDAVSSRALRILGTFDARHRRQTLTEIAARSGLALSTTHRFVKVLAEWGALHREEDRRYSVGRRIWRLGLLADVQQDIRKISAPFLQDLYGTTREVVFLAVRQEASALYIERIAGVSSPPLHAQVGDRLPLHATGVGKVLLAYAPDDVVAHVARAMARYTPFTVRDELALRRELEAVRTRGFARTREELGLGSASIAVPIQNSAGSAIAALGLVSSHVRKDLSRLLPAMQVTAQGISRSLP